MFLRIVRVVFGFVVACLAAGLTMVLFVYTPSEIANLPSDAAMERSYEAGVFALAVATHSAVFAAPLALIGAIIGEWRRIGSWAYYGFVGIVIAGIGFAAQYSSEPAGQASIGNGYALTAFLAAGFVAGVIYWLLSGRYANFPWEHEPPMPEILPPQASGSGPEEASRSS